MSRTLDLPMDAALWDTAAAPTVVATQRGGAQCVEGAERHHVVGSEHAVDAGVLAQQRGEGVVLILGARHPGQAVEEQGVVVAGGQSLQFRARPVQDDGAQRADLGVGAQHGVRHI